MRWRPTDGPAGRTSTACAPHRVQHESPPPHRSLCAKATDCLTLETPHRFCVAVHRLLFCTAHWARAAALYVTLLGLLEEAVNPEHEQEHDSQLVMVRCGVLQLSGGLLLRIQEQRLRVTASSLRNRPHGGVATFCAVEQAILRGLPMKHLVAEITTP